MLSVGMMLRMGLAALVSGSAAGLLAMLTLFFGALFFGWPGGWWVFAMLGGRFPLWFLAGLTVLSLPALLAGAAMCGLGDSFPAARRPLAWAAAGAAVGGALWALFCLILGSVARGGLDALDVALLAATVIGGAGGALAFLGTLRLSGHFWPETPAGPVVTERLRRLAQLALAALVASAAGGLILSVLLLFVAFVVASAGGGGGAGSTLADAAMLLGVVIFGSGLAMTAAVGAGWLPAFFAGAALSVAGRSRGWARRRLAWTVAGAAVALVCYVQAFPPGAPDPSAGRFPVPRPAVAALFMLAGAAAGQVYRSAMLATAPCFGLDERDETE